MERRNSNIKRKPVRTADPASADRKDGPSRKHVALEDVVHYEHAEAAAFEAYRRSQEAGTPFRVSSKRVGTRQSLEGIHLQQARLRRNKSLCNSGTQRHARNDDAARTARSSPGSHNPIQQSATTRLPQRTLTVTAHGSPTRRKKAGKDSLNTAKPSTAHVQQFSYEAGPADEELIVIHTKPPCEYSQSSPVQASSEIQCNAPALEHTKSSPTEQEKVRKRRSFLLGPVQKLRKRSSTLHSAQPWTRDHTVPPFNLAEDDYLPPPPNAQDDSHQFHARDERHSRAGKARLLSFAVKTRIRGLLKRASTQPAELPPQHITAKQLHYGHPNTSAASRQTTYATEPSTRSIVSPVTVQDPRSRVTSWTNSATTHSSRTQSVLERPTQASEFGSLQRSASGQSVHNRSAYLARSVHNKLRKPSRPALGSSKGSQGLYTALQNLIQSSRKDGHAEDGPHQESGRLQDDDLVAIPPPPAHLHSAFESRASTAMPTTIRAITPQLQSAELHPMSPVVEMTSPEACVRLDTGPQMDAKGSWNNHNPANFSPTPSPARLDSRMQRAKERWRDVLDVNHPAYHDTEVNPYELSAIEQQLTSNHTRAARQSPGKAIVQTDSHMTNTALSPSIYSETSGGTPERKTAMTSVTITSREVRSYQISPSKTKRVISNEHPVKVSSEWRRWLSGELRDFSNTLGMVGKISPTTQVPVCSDTTTTPLMEASSSLQSTSSPDSDQLEASAGHKSRSKHRESSRPSTGNRRRSSFMNDRYPTIESSRPSSRQSGQSRQTSEVFTGLLAKKTSVVAGNANSGRHKSIADIVSALRSQSAMSSNGKESLEVDSAVQDVSHAVNRRPQSSAELRAHFRSSLSENARPVGIQRKSGNKKNIMALMANDDTLRQISAGPYAVDNKAEAWKGRESTPPVAMADKELPALSSSTWLAGSTAKPHDGSHTLRSSGLVNASGRGGTPSPGQRLATGWMKGRSPVGSGSAFV